MKIFDINKDQLTDPDKIQAWTGSAAAVVAASVQRDRSGELPLAATRHLTIQLIHAVAGAFAPAQGMEVLRRAAAGRPRTGALWWTAVILRGVLPAVFAIAMGMLVGAVQRGDPLAAAGVVGTCSSCCRSCRRSIRALGANLGDRTAAWLYDRLTEACVRPPGMGHLENPKLTSDLTVARDFDLGMTGPPLSISMDFIAGGLVENDRRPRVGGRAVVTHGGRRWCSAARGWRPTGCCAKAPSGAIATPTKCAAPSVTRTTPTDLPSIRPPPRSCGCSDWLTGRSIASSPAARNSTQLQYQATGCASGRCCGACCSSSAPIRGVLVTGDGRADGGLDLGEMVVFAQSAVGTSMIAFGGLNWALDGAAAPVAAVQRLEPMASAGPAGPRSARRSAGARGSFSRRDFRVSGRRAGARGFDLTIPAGSSLAIVGQNGAGKTTLAKLLCRLYDPQSGAIEVDGVDLRALDLESWRSRLTAVFQDFIRLELPLRDNVAPAGAPDASSATRSRRPAPDLASSTPCSLAATTAAPISPAANGSAWRWRARCAR